MPRATPVAVSLLVFIAIAAAAFFRDTPLIAADEVGYLGIARYLVTGAGPNMASANYYWPGYSFLIAPLLWLIEDPRSAYTAIIVLNAGLGAAFFLCCYRIARDLDFPEVPSLVAALITALWPAYFLQYYFAWPETTFRLLFAIAMLCALRLARSPGLLWSILFALANVALMATHARAVPLVPLAIVFVLGLALYRRLTWLDAAVSVAILIVGAASVHVGNDHFREALWGGDRPGLSLRNQALSALSKGGLGGLLRAGIGQIWEQLVSSLGLVLFGAVAMYRIFTAADAPKGVRAMIAYAALASLAVFFMSTISMAIAARLDHVVYGRYVDGVAFVYLLIALAAILSGRLLSTTVVLVSLGLIALLGLALNVATPVALTRLNFATVPGIANFWMAVGQIAVPQHVKFFILISLVASALIIIGFGLLQRWHAAVALFLALFVVASDCLLDDYLRREQAGHGGAVHQAAAEIGGLAEQNIYWHKSAWGTGRIYLVQYLLPQKTFIRTTGTDVFPLVASTTALGASCASLQLLGGAALYTAGACKP